tara:strand:- start:1160 stop:2221 length:1062 start_codon:yes stop_codon:yes gene_type:complete
MAAFTTIAAATVAVGGKAAKGFLAGDAAKVAAREAGRLEIKQEQLQQESIARLEQDFFEAVRATTDIYDKNLQLSNVQGRQLVEAAQEGDQRGVAATAGKVKQVQDVGSGQIADKMAMQKLNIDMARAKANETDAARIAALQDDRAAAAGLEAKAKRAEADALQGEATGAFIDAGTSALTSLIGAFGNAEGRAAKKLVESGEAPDLTSATNMLQGLDNKFLRQVAKSGTMQGLASAAGPDATNYDGPVFETSFNLPLQDNAQVVGPGLLDKVKSTAADLFNFKKNNTVQKSPAVGLNSNPGGIMGVQLDFLNNLITDPTERVKVGAASSDELGTYFSDMFKNIPGVNYYGNQF